VIGYLIAIGVLAIGALSFGYNYRKSRAERTAWLEHDRQIRRDRGEDV